MKDANIVLKIGLEISTCHGRPQLLSPQLYFSTKFQNDWATKTAVMCERDFARELSSRGISYITKAPECINSLWPSGGRNGSILGQVMACCLTPSHNLTQCWLISNEAFWHLPEGNFTRNAQTIYPWYEFEKKNNLRYRRISQGPMS